jgi:hypothetical protein
MTKSFIAVDYLTVLLSGMSLRVNKEILQYFGVFISQITHNEN